jgi:hypothetical protein
VDDQWSALTEAQFLAGENSYPLRITELMYHPRDSADAEFIEIYNTSSVPIDLSGMSVAGVDFIYPPGTVLAPRSFSILVRNEIVFRSRYPGVEPAGNYSGALSNEGEAIEIRDRWNQPLLAVTYEDANDWPAEAAGEGKSLHLLSLTGSSAQASKWTAAAPNPGQFRSVTAVEFRIDSSLTSATAGEFTIQVSLPAAGEVHLQRSTDLSEWETTDSLDATDNRAQFVIPISTDRLHEFYRVLLQQGPRPSEP